MAYLRVPHYFPKHVPFCNGTLPVANLIAQRNHHVFRAYSNDSNRVDSRDDSRVYGRKLEGRYRDREDTRPFREVRRFINKRNRTLAEYIPEYDVPYTKKTERIDKIDSEIDRVSRLTGLEAESEWGILLKSAHTSQFASDVLRVFAALTKFSTPNLIHIQYLLNAVRRIAPLKSKTQTQIQVRKLTLDNLGKLKSWKLVPSNRIFSMAVAIAESHEDVELCYSIFKIFYDDFEMSPLISHYESLSKIFFSIAKKAEIDKDVQNMTLGINGIQECFEAIEQFYGMCALSQEMRNRWLLVIIMAGDTSMAIQVLEKFSKIHQDLTSKLKSDRALELETLKQLSSGSEAEEDPDNEFLKPPNVLVTKYLHQYLAESPVSEIVFSELLKKMLASSDKTGDDLKADAADMVRSLIEWIATLNIKPSALLYEYFLNTCKLTGANLDIWNMMLQQGIEPSFACYENFISSLEFTNTSPEIVMELITEMSNKGMPISPAIYNVLIYLSSLYMKKIGLLDISKIFDLYDKMKAESVKPNDETFDRLLKSLLTVFPSTGNKSDLQSYCERVLKLMNNRRILPKSANVFCSMVNYLSKAEFLNPCTTLVSHFLENRPADDLFTLIRNSLLVNEVSSTWLLVEQFLSTSGSRVSERIPTILMNKIFEHASKQGVSELENCFKYFLIMIKGSEPNFPTPNVETLNTLIFSCRSATYLRGIEHVFEYSKTSKIRLNSFAFAAYVEILVKNSRQRDAYDILNVMREQKLMLSKKAADHINDAVVKFVSSDQDNLRKLISELTKQQL